MEKLDCGCFIFHGRFVMGDKCKEESCKECKFLVTFHPFGRERLEDNSEKVVKIYGNNFNK